MTIDICKWNNSPLPAAAPWKLISSIGAQGDVLFRRVSALPEGLKRDPAVVPTVAHSESGHHHLARARKGFEVEQYLGKDNQPAFLRIRRTGEDLRARLDAVSDTISAILRDAGVVLTHEKQGPDAHAAEALLCPEEEAVYEILRQVELRPEGWVRVQD